MEFEEWLKTTKLHEVWGELDEDVKHITKLRHQRHEKALERERVESEYAMLSTLIDHLTKQLRRDRRREFK